MGLAVDPANTPVFILAGGLGTRLKEQTEFRPKPMIELGNKPILWHIMRWYGSFGFKKFVVCAGFKSEVIKEYFLNYDAMNSDFTVDLSMRRPTVYHSAHHEEDWEVTVAYTGELTMTGGRIGRAVAKYLGGAEHFAVTYGDGLTNADLLQQFAFHKQHGKIGTVLAINPPSRFGDLMMDGDTVVKFAEKPELSDTWINAGYFFFRRDFASYLSIDENLVLEREPLMRLAEDGQLAVWRHRDFWACMDTQRDRDELEVLWRSGKAPWTRLFSNRN
jgi:glucose-1-phosphate cytidylyltransferase